MSETERDRDGENEERKETLTITKQLLRPVCSQSLHTCQATCLFGAGRGLRNLLLQSPGRHWPQKVIEVEEN